MPSTSPAPDVGDLPKVGSREAHLRFGQLVQRAQWLDETVVITRHDRPAAVLVSIAEYERLTGVQRAA